LSFRRRLYYLHGGILTILLTLSQWDG
jgi:hypothetical protein